MRTLLLSGSLLLLVGCTPKLTFKEFARLEGTVQNERSGFKNEQNIEHVDLWYMGHRSGYEYYDYAYDEPSPDGLRHVEKQYRYNESEDTTHHGSWWPAYDGNGPFLLTSTRAKWVKYPEGNMHQFHPKPRNRTTAPATQAAGVTLNDLHS